MATIRSRLIVSFVLLVLLPAIAFGAVWVVAGLSEARQHAIDQLESVATLKEAELNTWVETLQADLALALSGEELSGSLRDLLTPDSDPMLVRRAMDRLHNRLGQMVAQTHHFDELFVMDLQGRVVLSTDLWREGRFGAPGSQGYLQLGLQGPYLHPPSYNLSVGGFAITAVLPIRDRHGHSLGILAGRASLATLSEIMLERIGLGETGETYLVTPSYIMLTAPRLHRNQWSQVTYVFTPGASSAIAGKASGWGAYRNYQRVPVMGVYHWLPQLQVALLAEQAESEAMGAIYQTLKLNVALAAVIVLFATLASLVLARSIVGPLGRLVDTAGHIRAGQLDQAAAVEHPDEIGVLAQAFNTMTGRLRDLVATLEQRVEDRTRALQRRALQLETTARVSREITSILALDDLLRRVVDLIREAFGYYHVAIFLVDERSNALVYRAGSTEGGEPPGAYATLKIGPDSLNGRVVQTNQPLLVDDVSQNPHYLAVESLPATCSELVIPLRVGEWVVGTLDVQSRQICAFDEEDVRIVQSLGDQVAVAIENARLYDRNRALAVVEERSRLARELHDSVTQSLYSLVLFAGAGQEAAAAGQLQHAEQHLGRIETIAQQAMREMRLLLHELRPPTLEQEGLVVALQQRLEAVERRVGVRAYLTADGRLDLPVPIQHEVYSIAQEALNNALKHAAASSVAVRLRADGDRMDLEVADDGVGFDPLAVKAAGVERRLGLSGMEERAVRLGGRLTIDSAPGLGTVVRLHFPVKSTLSE